ncbi:MAG: phosphate signaling complex protein PhoU [Anaerolineae bacterium]|nr:phosphate signaling complex protein PhoU [Anaerolineales bacterium]MCQ3974583.1 phosphate transport system regulatory protein PhoU [Anaerolineae bacterium]
MLRESFHRDLHRLHEDILLLGSMVESMLTDAVDVLKRRDMAGSQRLIAYDQRVNEKRLAIEHNTLTLIATQQPMAGDVRDLAAILDIASELERIGDYAKGIAKINLMIGPGELIKPLVDIPRMAEKARDMLHRALEAFINRDVDLARTIPLEDDEVDDLYNQVYRELITLIMKNPQDMDQATYLMWAAHNLERTADRVGNICERVIFTVTGEVIEFSMPIETA